MAERDGIYRVFRIPAVYDLAQRAVRSQRSRREFFRRYVRAAPGMRVLDLGCGTGDALHFLPDVDYCGVDHNARYLRIARRRHAARAVFVEADLSRLGEIPSKSFDVALALGVLHHLDDESCRRVFAGAAVSLALGGRFVTHDPAITPDQSTAARWFVRHDRGKHVRTADKLAGLAREVFGTVSYEIVARPLRIPFTEVVVECSGPKFTSS